MFQLHRFGHPEVVGNWYLEPRRRGFQLCMGSSAFVRFALLRRLSLLTVRLENDLSDLTVDGPLTRRSLYASAARGHRAVVLSEVLVHLVGLEGKGELKSATLVCAASASQRLGNIDIYICKRLGNQHVQVPGAAGFRARVSVLVSIVLAKSHRSPTLKIDIFFSKPSFEMRVFLFKSFGRDDLIGLVCSGHKPIQAKLLAFENDD
jgi:hypothetical protein